MRELWPHLVTSIRNTAISAFTDLDVAKGYIANTAGSPRQQHSESEANFEPRQWTSVDTIQNIIEIVGLPPSFDPKVLKWYLRKQRIYETKPSSKTRTQNHPDCYPTESYPTYRSEIPLRVPTDENYPEEENHYERPVNTINTCNLVRKRKWRFYGRYNLFLFQIFQK